MKSLLQRPVLAFALGAALAAAVAGGTAAYASLADERVSACYAPKTGVLSVIGRDGVPTSCPSGHVPIDWSERGPQGPPGVFSGKFTSPNGAYSLGVTDDGIVLAGPGASFRLSGTTLELLSSGATTIHTGTAFALASGTSAALQAGTNLALASGGSTAFDVDRDLSVGVDGATSLLGTGNVTVQSANVATLRGSKGAVVESSGPVTIRGASTTVQAVGLNALKGALIQANGSNLP